MFGNNQFIRVHAFIFILSRKPVRNQLRFETNTGISCSHAKVLSLKKAGADGSMTLIHDGSMTLIHLSINTNYCIFRCSPGSLLTLHVHANIPT